eukprot:gene21451-25797_t
MRRLLEGGFETVPLSLLIQMGTVFSTGGLRARGEDGERYLDLLGEVDTPALVIAGGVDPVIPPSVVKDTAARMGKGEYVCFGKECPEDDQACVLHDDGMDLELEEEPNYFSHYDLLVGKRAPDEVFPLIVSFLDEHNE